jgi:hypothetical protein
MARLNLFGAPAAAQELHGGAPGAPASLPAVAEPGLNGTKEAGVAGKLAQVQAHWAYEERRGFRSGVLGRPGAPAYEFNLNMYNNIEWY